MSVKEKAPGYQPGASSCQRHAIHLGIPPRTPQGTRPLTRISGFTRTHPRRRAGKAGDLLSFTERIFREPPVNGLSRHNQIAHVSLRVASHLDIPVRGHLRRYLLLCSLQRNRSTPAVVDHVIMLFFHLFIWGMERRDCVLPMRAPKYPHPVFWCRFRIHEEVEVSRLNHFRHKKSHLSLVEMAALRFPNTLQNGYNCPVELELQPPIYFSRLRGLIGIGFVYFNPVWRKSQAGFLHIYLR